MNDIKRSHSKILNAADCRQIPLWKINFTSENVSRDLELELPRTYHIGVPITYMPTLLVSGRSNYLA